MFPPGPRSPYLVQLARWLLQPSGFLEECGARYGDIFTLRTQAEQPTVFTSNPQAIRTIFAAGPDEMAAPREQGYESLVGRYSLLMMNGAEHQRHRRLLGKALHLATLPELGPAILTSTRASLHTWPIGRPFPVYEAMRELLMNVLLRVLFGLSATDTKKVSQLISAGIAIAANPTMIIPLSMQKVMGRFAPWAKLGALGREVDVIVRAQIARSRVHAENTILSRLITTRDENGNGLSDDEVRDEIMTLFFASHDTTASAVAWTLSFVLSHLEVQAKLAHEVESIDVQDSDAAQAVRIKQLPFLDATLRESLRLRPVFQDVRRLLLQPMKLLGYELPAGVQVAPCIYLAQRRADVYREPQRFMPQRFLTQRPGPEEWLPFGGGMRRCVGMSLGWDLMKLILGTLFSRLTFLPMADGPARPARRFVSVVPAGGVPVIVQPRAIPLKRAA